jgi:DNA-binding winged helix-turn-helix (wHTH) protein
VSQGRDQAERLLLTAASVDLRTGRVQAGAESRTLTGRELSLLVYLAERPDTTVPKGTLATEVFGFHPNARTRVVDVTLNRLRHKLDEPTNPPRHLVTVYGEGVRFVPLAPVASVPLIGRDAELAQLQDPAHRVHCLLGFGGLGKTQLARAVAARTPGAVFVDVSDACTVEALQWSVARALGLFAPEPSAHAVRERLQDLAPPLVVLDNLEQLDEAGDAVVDGWLADSGTTRWILTTRRALALATAHRVLALAPLSEADATRLLGEGLEAATDAELTPIVRHLGGIPLVVVLAGARGRLLGLPALEAHLASHGVARLGVVGEGRHGSVRAMVAWSLGLLDPGLRDALAGLALFPGVFEGPDAAELLGPEGALQLQSLQRHQLLRQVGEARWELPVAVREVLVDTHPPTEAARRRFLRWCSGTAVRIRDGLRSPRAVEAFKQILGRWPAWQRALVDATLDLDAASAILEVVGRTASILGVLRPPDEVWRIHADTPPDAWPDRWRLALARCAYGASDSETSLRLLRAGEMADPFEGERLSLELSVLREQWRHAELEAPLARLRVIAEARQDALLLGKVAINASFGDPRADRDRRMRRAAHLFARAEAPLDQADVLITRAFALAHGGDPTRGERLADKGLALLHGMQPNFLTVRLLLAAAFSAVHLDRLDVAREHYLQARDQGRRIDRPAVDTSVVIGLARVAEARGDHDEAVARIRGLLADSAKQGKLRRNLLVHAVMNLVLAGRPPEVVEALEELVDLCADQPTAAFAEPVMTLLALLLGKLGCVAPSEALVAAAARVRPTFSSNDVRLQICRLPAVRARGEDDGELVAAIVPTLPINQLHRTMWSMVGSDVALAPWRDALVALGEELLADTP